jgi:hypothetical protein
MLMWDSIQAYLLCYPNRDYAPRQVPRFGVGVHPLRSQVGS